MVSIIDNAAIILRKCLLLSPCSQLLDWCQAIWVAHLGSSLVTTTSIDPAIIELTLLELIK